MTNRLTESGTPGTPNTLGGRLTIPGITESGDTPVAAQRIDLVRQVEGALDVQKALSRMHPINRLGAFLGAQTNTTSDVELPPSWQMGQLVIPANKLADLEQIFRGGHVLPTQTVIFQPSNNADGALVIPVVCASVDAVHETASVLGASYTRSALPQSREVSFVPKHGILNASGVTSERPLDLPENGGAIATINAFGNTGAVVQSLRKPLQPDTAFAGATQSTVRNYLKDEMKLNPLIGNTASYFLVNTLGNGDVRNKIITALKHELNARRESSGVRIFSLGNTIGILDAAETSIITRIIEGLHLAQYGDHRMVAGNTAFTSIRGPSNFVVAHIDPGVLELMRAGNIPHNEVMLDPKTGAALSQALQREGEITANNRLLKFGRPRAKKEANGKWLCSGVDYNYGEDIQAKRLVGESATRNAKDLDAALKNPAVKLALLVGEGGSGKTTLLNHVVKTQSTPLPMLICPPNDTNRDVPGRAMLDIFEAILRRIPDKTNEPAFAKFKAFMQKDVAARRVELTNEDTKQNAFSMIAATLKCMNVYFGIEDLHQLGVALTDVVTVILKYLQLGGKKVIGLTRKNYQGEQVKNGAATPTKEVIEEAKILDALCAEVRKFYGEDSVVEIQVKGVDFSLLENCIDKLSDCISDSVRKEKFPGAKGDSQGIDAATALALGIAAGAKEGNPYKFEDIAATLLEEGTLVVLENGLIGCPSERLPEIENLASEGSYNELVSRRASDLLNTADGPIRKYAAESIALIGRVSREQLTEILSRHPDMISRGAEGIEEFIDSLSTGRQIVEYEDPVTQRPFFRIAHDRVRTMLISNMSSVEQARVGEILDKSLGTLDSSARFALRMYRMVALKSAPQGLMPEVAQSVTGFCDAVTTYLEELKGLNSVDEIRAVAERVLKIPFINGMYESLIGGSLDMERLEPAVVRTLKLITDTLFEKGWADCEQQRGKDAEESVARLGSIHEKTQSHLDLVNSWDHKRLKFNALCMQGPRKEKEFMPLIAELRSMVADGSFARTQLHKKRPSFGELTDVVCDENAHCLAEHAVDMSTALAFTASRQYVSPAHAEKHVDLQDYFGALTNGNAGIGQAYKSLQMVNIEWGKRFNGMPSPLYLEFYRNCQFLIPFHTLRDKFDAPHFKAYLGTQRADQHMEDSYREVPNAMSDTDLATLGKLRGALETLYKVHERFPTAMSSKQLGSLYGYIGQVGQMEGNFASSIIRLKQGLSLALNSGNFILAARCLKFIVDSQSLHAQVKPAPEGSTEGKWTLRTVGHEPTLREAMELACSETSQTIENNLDSKNDSFWRFVMEVVRVEKCAQWARSITPQLLKKLVVTAAGQGDVRVADQRAAVLELNEIKYHLLQGYEVVAQCEAFVGQNPDFAPDAAYYMCSQAAHLAEAAARFDASRAMIAPGVDSKPLPDFNALPMLQSDVAFKGVSFGVTNLRDNPLFVGPNSEAMMRAGVNNVEKAPDMLALLDQYTGEIHRFMIGDNGRAIPETAPTVPNPGESGRRVPENANLKFFAERDVLSQYTPNELTASDRKVFEKVRAEALKRNEASFDPRNSIAAAEASTILGDYYQAMELVQIPANVDDTLLRRATLIYARASFWSSILEPTGSDGRSFRSTLARNDKRNKEGLQTALENNPDRVVDDPTLPLMTRAEGWLMTAFTVQALARKTMPTMAVANKFNGNNLDEDRAEVLKAEEAVKNETDPKELNKKQRILSSAQEILAKTENKLADFRAGLGETFVQDATNFLHIGYNALDRLNHLTTLPADQISEPQRIFITNAVTAIGATLIDCIDAIRIGFPEQYEASGAANLRPRLIQFGLLAPNAAQLSISGRIVSTLVGLDSLMHAEASNYLLVKFPTLDRSNYK